MAVAVVVEATALVRPHRMQPATTHKSAPAKRNLRPEVRILPALDLDLKGSVHSGGAPHRTPPGSVRHDGSGCLVLPAPPGHQQQRRSDPEEPDGDETEPVRIRTRERR
jgi:hypothetical protein